MKRKQPFDRAGYGAFAILIGGMGTVYGIFAQHEVPYVSGALLAWGLWMYLPTRRKP